MQVHRSADNRVQSDRRGPTMPLSGFKHVAGSRLRRFLAAGRPGGSARLPGEEQKDNARSLVAAIRVDRLYCRIDGSMDRDYRAGVISVLLG